MTTSIASVVARFKDDPKQHLDHRLVLETSVDVDHSWRDRVLNPTTTLRLFILQVLVANDRPRLHQRVDPPPQGQIAQNPAASSQAAQCSQGGEMGFGQLH